MGTNKMRGASCNVSIMFSEPNSMINSTLHLRFKKEKINLWGKRNVPSALTAFPKLPDILPVDSSDLTDKEGS